MAITNITRDWSDVPSIVRVVTTDNLAAITTAGYLTAQAANIAAIQHSNVSNPFDWQSTDYILIAYSGGIGFFIYDSVNLTFAAAAVVPGSLSDALLSGRIFVGSAGNVATGVALSGDATITNAGVMTIAANAVDTGKLALDTIQYIQVPMTAAQWNGMYAAPFEILPAPGAGLIYQVDAVWYDMAFVAAQYAAGGVVNLQYDATINGAGVLVTQDVAAATINGLAASSIVRPALGITEIAQATTVNKSLCMSNKTAAFTTGDSTWKINVAYRIITA